ncbi:MAG: hypothetical protein GY810_31690 [Aureispira sp.]|nr:hypothetical protein [Aureispira sp.]
MKKYIPLGLFSLLVFYLIYLLIKKEKTKQEAAQKIQASKENIFNPEPYTEAIYNDLTKGWGEYSKLEAYTDVTKLSDDDIRAIWYDWELNYKDKAGTYKGYSLGAAIDYANFYYSSSKEASDKLIKKLKTLNLT